MSLNALIINTLKHLNVQVSFQEYTGSAGTFITFFEFSQTPAVHADDEELQSNHSIQINIFSKSDYTELVRQVKTELKIVGFKRTFETELYELDTKVYHKVLRFNFVEEA
ncbi:MAG: hypothetical protein K0R18_569 [Bacillales bacterium]|jgi:hypothetical protein|nr:hypothetical protein [Bacillales bacterium]